MKELKMKRPDLEDRKYRNQKVINDDAILDFIADTDNYIDELELAIYKKNEEIEELKKIVESAHRPIQEFKVSDEIFNAPYKAPGDPMDD